LGSGPLGTFLSGESSSSALAGGGGGGTLITGTPGMGCIRCRWPVPTGEWRAADAVDISIISGRSTSSAAAGATFLIAAIAIGCRLLLLPLRPLSSFPCCEPASTVATLL
ncbi:hypothetical protein BAE44_0023111, partial [Dichanthelium oligosanthes]